VYDVYGTCSDGTSPLEEEKRDLSQGKKGYTIADYTPWLFKNPKHGAKNRLKDLPPCTFGIPL